MIGGARLLPLILQQRRYKVDLAAPTHFMPELT